MEIDGHCRSCGRSFDAHWHNYPDLSTSEAILKPYCLYCKSTDIWTTNDESNDPPENYDQYPGDDPLDWDEEE